MFDFLTPALKIIERVLNVIPLTPKEKETSKRYKDEKEGREWLKKIKEKLFTQK